MPTSTVAKTPIIKKSHFEESLGAFGATAAGRRTYCVGISPETGKTGAFRLLSETSCKAAPSLRQNRSSSVKICWQFGHCFIAFQNNRQFARIKKARGLVPSGFVQVPFIVPSGLMR